MTNLAPRLAHRLPSVQLMRFLRDPLTFLEQLAKQGDVVSFSMGPRKFVFLVHPNDIRDVLVTHQKQFTKTIVLRRAKRVLGDGLLTNEGDDHLRQRRLVQPAFHKQRIMGYTQTMIDQALAMRETWQEDQIFDVHHAMMRLTLDIVGKTLFGTNVDAEAQTVGESLEFLLNRFSTLIMPYAELYERLPLAGNRRATASMNQLNTIMQRIVNERRASGEDHGDLLSMLLLAQDVEGDGGRMSNQQVRDEALTLFLAGHETTANALTWTWMLLAQHPDIEAKLHAELDSVLAGRTPTFDDVPQLRYTRMIISESMRLYPPAWSLGRETIRDYTVRGQTFPAGTSFLLSPYITQRDPRWFDKPLAFKPERWAEPDQRPRFAYFPFGGGSRICIGEQFAWTEMIVVLATLAQRWQLRLDPMHRIIKQPTITLRPKHGVRMWAERRGMMKAE